MNLLLSLESIPVKRDENERQVDKIQSMASICGNLAKLDLCFPESFPTWFTREIYFCEIWKMQLKQQPCFHLLKVGTGYQALQQFMHIIVSLLGDSINMEQHQTCKFSSSCQISFLSFPGSLVQCMCSSTVKSTRFSIRGWKQGETEAISTLFSQLTVVFTDSSLFMILSTLVFFPHC